MTSQPSTSDTAKPDAPDLSALPSGLSAVDCDQIVQTIRGKAEETIAQLQQEVFRLIDQAGPAAGAPPHAGAAGSTASARPAQSGPAWNGDAAGHRGQDFGGAESQPGDPHGVILQVVRQEIERINLPQIVAAEVRRQMQAFAEQLQEHMKRKRPSALKKTAPSSLRQRR